MSRRTMTDGVLTLSYGGGRLADILGADGVAVEGAPVRGYDWSTGEFTEPEPDDQTVLARARDWLADQDEQWRRGSA